MSMMAGGGPPGDGESEQDYPLTPDEINELMRELARAFNTEDRALVLLRSVRFPRELIPEFGITGSLNFWTMIFNDLDNGVVVAPYRRLITGALSIFEAHQGLASLQRKYQETQATTPPPPPQPASAT